ncbi:BTB/POZ domain-containing protein 6-like [Lutzomyia longipalpis]|uniref:BTB/POZ domain-containing protein 6-like n=1 Tax=Lutzomyia longipalpis TaxID=7200 RepID=UPI002484447B|nr:BTB/POZ domain-containing protein 6-like [Lutzomyia longipalpis]XP_055691579.1 BTB/POZ domain-containing protein 6-like [Lutzomyia longipalpis]
MADTSGKKRKPGPASRTNKIPRKKFGYNGNINFIFPNDDGAVLLADKLKLMAVSEVWLNQLPRCEISEPEDITIEDIPYAVFSAMVDFVSYSDNGKPVLDVNEGNFQVFLYAAKKYFIYSVLHEIVKFLQNFIKAENLAEHFEFIERFDMQPIMEHFQAICIRFPLHVIRTLNTSPPHKRILQMILESPLLNCNEYSLFYEIMEMLIRDGKGHPGGGQNGESDCMRRELGRLLYLIRFPTMTIEEFIMCTEAPTPLTDKEAKDILLWLNGQIYSSTIKKFNLKPRFPIAEP